MAQSKTISATFNKPELKIDYFIILAHLAIILFIMHDAQSYLKMSVYVIGFTLIIFGLLFNLEPKSLHAIRYTIPLLIIAGYNFYIGELIATAPITILALGIAYMEYTNN